MSVTVIKAAQVESFMYPPNPTGRGCAFKSCNHVGRIILFWKENEDDTEQEKSYICTRHALVLANDVLSKYKFGYED